MSKPFIVPILAQVMIATAGRTMTRPAYAAVVFGVLTMVVLTVNPAYEAAHHWVYGPLWMGLAFFAFEWLVRLHFAAMSQRTLMALRPDLAQTIDAEAKRRELENQ